MRNPGKVLVNQGLTGAPGIEKPHTNQARRNKKIA